MGCTTLEAPMFKVLLTGLAQMESWELYALLLGLAAWTCKCGPSDLSRYTAPVAGQSGTLHM